MMQRFPKIVAAFTYTKNTAPLLNKLNGAVLASVRDEVLAFRSAAELQEKIKFVTLGNNNYEWYPKIATTREFTEAEYASLEAARLRVVSTVLTFLQGEGATNIVIHSNPVT